MIGSPQERLPSLDNEVHDGQGKAGNDSSSGEGKKQLRSQIC